MKFKHEYKVVWCEDEVAKYFYVKATVNFFNKKHGRG